MRFARQFSPELATLVVVSAIFGGLVGVSIASAAYLVRASTVATELAQSTARVKFLEGLVEEGTRFGGLEVVPSLVVAEASLPETTQVAESSIKDQVIPPKLQSEANVSSPQVLPSPSPDIPAQAEAPTRALVTPDKEASAAAKPAPIAAKVPVPARPVAKPQQPSAPNRAQTAPPEKMSVASPASVVNSSPAPAGHSAVEAPVPAVSPERRQEGTVVTDDRYRVSAGEIKATLENGRVEGVSAQKAGVSRIGPGLVRMASGREVRVGEVFPSGERLLQVDPANNRLVTSDRQILLFFQ